MKYQIAVFLFALGCLLGLSDTSYSDPAKSPVWIQMRRSACYGKCPIYLLTVLRDGTVTYHGDAFTLVKGTRETKLSDSSVEKLKRLISTSIFANLSADCCKCNDMTDHPTTTLEIANEHCTKIIEHYHGCKAAPRALSDLEDQIDEATGAIQWIGTREQRKDIRF